MTRDRNARQREYRAKHRERLLARRRELYAKNPEKHRSRARQYYTENKELCAERAKKKPRDRVKAEQKRYRDSHKELQAARYKAWCAKNPDRLQAYVAGRRALRLAAVGRHTAQDRKSLLLSYNHRCGACGRSSQLQIDHIVPLSRGGADDISNLQVLCKSCNCSKGSKTAFYPPFGEAV